MDVIRHILGKNRQVIDRSIFFLKQIYYDNSKKLRFSRNRARSFVEWYIGCEKGGKSTGSVRRSSFTAAAREGIEFYINGNFYEGEFHKGKPTRSGVYTYIINSQYEGDWVDRRYDGYGIESWARGSRYLGQYSCQSWTLPAIRSPTSGVMRSIMGLGCKFTQMAVAMLASSSVASNMALVATISGLISN